jgi:hypothetical protein
MEEADEMQVERLHEFDAEANSDGAGMDKLSYEIFPILIHL